LPAVGVSVVEASPSGIAEWLTECAPDAVCGYGIEPVVAEAIIAAGLPWVDAVHGVLPFENPGLEQADAVVVPSAATVPYVLHERPQTDHRRIHVVHHWLEDHWFAPPGDVPTRSDLQLPEGFLLLSLGWYGGVKNAFGTVNAFAELARRTQDATLVLAGSLSGSDGLYLAQVIDRVRHLKLTDRVLIRAQCPYPRLLLPVVDCLVVNSFLETGPLVTMEALASGTPVVASDVGAVRQQLAGDELGHVVGNPAGAIDVVTPAMLRRLKYEVAQPNLADLVGALLAMSENRETWHSRRPRTRELARDRFGPGPSVRAYAELFDAVRTRSRNAGPR
jgi:glycosyltransferase involved in cell wall biosynthesis